MEDSQEVITWEQAPVAEEGSHPDTSPTDIDHRESNQGDQQGERQQIGDGEQENHEVQERQQENEQQDQQHQVGEESREQERGDQQQGDYQQQQVNDGQGEGQNQDEERNQSETEIERDREGDAHGGEQQEHQGQNEGEQQVHYGEEREQGGQEQQREEKENVEQREQVQQERESRRESEEHRQEQTEKIEYSTEEVNTEIPNQNIQDNAVEQESNHESNYESNHERYEQEQLNNSQNQHSQNQHSQNPEPVTQDQQKQSQQHQQHQEHQQYQQQQQHQQHQQQHEIVENNDEQDIKREDTHSNRGNNQQDNKSITSNNDNGVSPQYFHEQRESAGYRDQEILHSREHSEHQSSQKEPFALYHRDPQEYHHQSSPPDQSVENLDNREDEIVHSSNSRESSTLNQQPIQSSQESGTSKTISFNAPPSHSNPSSVLHSTATIPIPVPTTILEQQPQPEPPAPEIPPHDDFQVMILPTQGMQPAVIGKMYSSAFQQRRETNRKLMMQLFDKRNSYYLTHVGVFDHIRLGLRLRIKNSRDAIQSFKQFFKQQMSIYNEVINSMKHVIELRSKTQTESLNVHWSSQITQGVYKNIEDQSEIIDMMKEYKTLMNENFISQMEQAWREYQRVLEGCENTSIQSKKEFTKFQEKIIDMEKDIHKKFKKEQKYPDKKGKGYDLAEEEIVLFREMKVGKEKLTRWGETVIEWWQEQITEEIKLLTRVKQLVNNFVDLTNKVHIISKHIRSRSAAWNLESVQQDVAANYQFENIVCLTDIDFVRGSLETYNRLPRPDKISISDVETFNKIEYQERIIGKRDIIIECLIVKEFKCKRMVPGQEELEIVRVIATIDDNLLVIDIDQKVINSKLKQLLNTRPEGNVVKVNYKKKGWFIDDWECVYLEFKSEDKAEEFMFFTETNSETRKQYVV